MTELLPIRVGRIVVRPTTEADLDWVIATEALPENAFGIIPWTRDQHRAVIAGRDGLHSMIEARPDGRVVGFLILRGLDGPDRAIELKRIVVSEKGNGFGREGLQAAKELAFERLGAHRLWLDVFTDHERAQSLYESDGFVREGVLRESVREGERYRSLVLLSILAPEYQRAGG